MIRIGLDLGGTKIEAVALDPSGNILLRHRVATEAAQGLERVLRNMRVIYDDTLAELGRPKHSLGICTPGSISPQTGLMQNSNIIALNGRPLDRELEHVFARPIVVENDANCFALAEATLGAGQGAQTVFGAIIGTGCGGGWVHRGHLLVGRHRIAGEWGHIPLPGGTAPCHCGRSGCIERYVSGSALSEQMAARHRPGMSGEMVVAAARDGDPLAREVLAGFIDHFGRALAIVVTLLDPDAIVLGGGLANLPELYADGVATLSLAVPTGATTTPILRPSLGDSAGSIGAALLGSEMI